MANSVYFKNFECGLSSNAATLADPAPPAPGVGVVDVEFGVGLRLLLFDVVSGRAEANPLALFGDSAGGVGLLACAGVLGVDLWLLFMAAASASPSSFMKCILDRW